ncbi:hypothetical protein EST38_g54 [Candolleomyces aberdarensis]|uniref:Nucleic acid-binding protein n=1 Tax=Candolleomyces aberdarensis TaxID=2316362 RepID=A0A4Q2E0D1_9AGAR|nr:hypothetical protein EST38_g54 [Candolleomyces aberdarensis]
MLSALRSSVFRPSSLRAFSTSAARRYDVAKLTLVGTLVRDPEARFTKSEKEYMVYTVATNDYPPPPPDANGERQQSSTTFHRILSFTAHQIKYLKTLRKGSRVFVEANYEVREPEAGADPSTPRGQRQIFLRQDSIRILNGPRHREQEHDASHESEAF